jgi:adenosine deaminase
VDWTLFPKVELHLHLDCSLSYGVVSTLDPSVTRDDYRARFIAPAKCTDLAEALQCARHGVALMQTEEQLRLVVFDLFEQLRKDNVLYAEIRFAPLLHLEQGLAPRQVVASVDSATAEAVRRTGIEARLILCTLRHFSEAQSLETVDLVDDFGGSHVAGFDLAADEAGYPVDAHVAAFRLARERGIPITAHAGEGAGPGSMWQVLQRLAPSRIGHGVRSIEDPDLLETLRQQQIHLEVCPTCNVAIDLCDTYADHPIDRLYRAGIPVGVNTDARTLANITLSQEYEKLQQSFGWGPQDFYQVNRNALNAAFLPDEARNRLLERLLEGYRQVPGFEG